MTLGDNLQQLVHDAAGDALLLDARNSRGIISDTTNIVDICRRLANGGFTRLIDFSAKHEEGEDYTLYLTLRHPAEHHAALTLKWKYSLDPEAGRGRTPNRPADNSEDGRVQGPAPTPDSEPAATGNGSPPAPAYNGNGGAGQPGGTPQRAGFAAHPTLSRVWRAAAVCEREMFELLGIPFAGNENLAPLFLEDSFSGNPLRNDYEIQPAADYATTLLKERHDEALLDVLAEGEGGGP